MLIPRSNKPPVRDTPTEEGDLSWLRSALIVPGREIVVILAVMLGPFICCGAYYGMTHPAGAFYQVISNHGLLVNAIFESLLLAMLLTYLHRRGWKPEDLRIRIGWRSSSSGVALFILAYASIIALDRVSLYIVRMLGKNALAQWVYLFVPHHFVLPKKFIYLSWGLLVGFSILNAFYEELVYMTYGFNLCAKKYGPQTAVLITVLLRIAIHTYQGTEHILSIGLWGLIFGLWYRYKRNVWPLVLAHFLTDCLSLGILKMLSGGH